MYKKIRRSMTIFLTVMILTTFLPTFIVKAALQTLEAENGTIGSGAVLMNDGNASGGKAVGNMHISNAYDQISGVDGGTSGGSYTLTIRYACNESGVSSVAKGLYVNGTKVQTLSFPLTGGWSTYSDLTVTITLNAGTSNNIMIKNDTTTGGVNLDKYTLSLLNGNRSTIGYWNLNEKYDKIAADSSGNNKTAAVNGGASWTTGILDNGLSFNGTNAYLNIPDSNSPSAFTVALWVKPSTQAAQNIFVRTSSAGATQAWSHQLRINSGGKFEACINDGSTKTVSGSTTVVTNTWYHIALTASNNGQLKLYVNGKQEGTPVNIGTMWTGGDRYWLGSNSNGFGWFNGIADEIKLYGYELSSSEISGLISSNISNVNVSLTSYFNEDAFSYDSNRSNGNFGNTGFTYSADLTNSNIVLDGASNQLGSFADNSNNSVKCSGQVIPLTQDVYNSIRLLGSSTIDGSSGTFRITYTDTSYTDINVSMGNWLSSVSGDNIAQTINQRHSSTGDDATTTYIYGYNMAVSSEKVVQSITLPNNSNMHVMAVTLVKDQIPVLSRSDRILLQRGFPLSAWVYTWGNTSPAAHISTSQFMGMNVNTPVFFESQNTYDGSLMSGQMANYNWSVSGAPTFPGIVGSQSSVLSTTPQFKDWLTPEQQPHANTLYCVGMGDEEGYSDALVNGLTEWFKVTRYFHPNVLMSNNQWGGEWNDNQMRNYIHNAKPDIIDFDAYVYDNSGDWNDTCSLISNTGRYRKFALEGWDGTGRSPIAFGQHINVAEIDGCYRTESETYCMPFVTVAMGGKWLNLFTIYTEAAHQGGYFFDANGNTTALYNFGSGMFSQIGKLAPHLLRLKSSAVSVLPGQHINRTTALENPISDTSLTPRFTANPTYYVSNVTATNPGTLNNGLPGDVVMGYFDTLPGTSQFFTSSNPKYFMVVNTLTAGAANHDPQWAMANGTSEMTKQNVTITFDLGTTGDSSKLKRVNRNTGAIESVALTPVSGSVYTLALTLGGGQGDLFFWAE